MTNWDRLVGEPSARLTGPFPRSPFLETWHRHRPVGEVRVVGSAPAVAAIVLIDGVARFAGEEHLTDYHAPLGPDPATLAVPLLDLGHPLVLDSLPVEVAVALEAGFAAAGVVVNRSEGEPCMVLDLAVPDEGGWEAWLGSKDRHEVRRKRRRFAAVHGEPALDHDHGAFGRFVDLHRSAPGEKGEFMTDAMAAFFESLLALDCARLDVVRGSDGAVIAAAFGFEDADAYYLYNSAFDSGEAEVSPGAILVDQLIQAEAAAGRRRFDFLKGTEVYKRRLGAVERPLVVLEVRE